VFEVLRTPEHLRVSEEVERGSKRLVETSKRTAAILHTFGQSYLLDLKIFEPVFERFDQRCALGINDAVEELTHFAFHASKLGLVCGRGAFELRYFL
jgi:hypothetical protein